MRKLLLAGMAAGLCWVAGSTLQAQVQVGPQLDFGTNSINFGIGGRAELNLAKTLSAPLTGVGSFDYFFGTAGVTYWEINANVFYNFTIPKSNVMPYAGGGLNIAHASVSCPAGFSCSATNAGLNLGGGAKFKMHGSKITPFAEARIELRTGSAFVLTGGILF